MAMEAVGSKKDSKTNRSHTGFFNSCISKTRDDSCFFSIGFHQENNQCIHPKKYAGS